MEAKGRTPHVGARLKALDEAVLMAVSDFSCNFVCILSSRFEQCEECRCGISDAKSSSLSIHHSHTRTRGDDIIVTP